jgi:phosphoribosylanthranilate isomerase
MTLVKICGLSESESLEAALNAGADFVGFVFYPKSPRNVSLEQAAALVAQVNGRARTVALTVDAKDDLLTAISREVRPDMFQAHGGEIPGRVGGIALVTGKPVIKAMKVSTPDHVEMAKEYAYIADFVLFDAAPPDGATLPGGNGLAFDWTILKGAHHPFMLAGGLNPDNVREAIRVTGAAMVDVSSGVESAPGKKDEALIRKFIERAKSAS